MKLTVASHRLNVVAQLRVLNFEIAGWSFVTHGHHCGRLNLEPVHVSLKLGKWKLHCKPWNFENGVRPTALLRSSGNVSLAVHHYLEQHRRTTLNSLVQLR